MTLNSLKAYLGRAVIGFALLSSKAFAHGGHDPRLKVLVGENEVRVETSLDARAFILFDRDKDGRLTVHEYESQIDTIAVWIDRHLMLTQSDDLLIKPYFADAPIVGGGRLDSADRVENIKILRRYKIGNIQDGLKLTVKFYDKSPQLLYSRSGALEKLFDFSICFQNRLEEDNIICRPSL